MQKSKKTLKKYFGMNAFGLEDLPRKLSGVRISRALIGEYMGCARCFPHGIEVVNAKWKKHQRNWKKYRRYQWKERT